MIQIREWIEAPFFVMAVAGRIDSDSLNVLENALNAHLEQKHYDLILDLSEVGYINSAGLRILTTALNICQLHGGELYVVGLSDKIREVFEIIGLHSFFRLYADLESCLNAVG